MPDTTVFIILYDDVASADIEKRINVYLAHYLPVASRVAVRVITDDSDSLINEIKTTIKDGSNRIILLTVYGNNKPIQDLITDIGNRYPNVKISIDSLLNELPLPETINDYLEKYAPEVFGDLLVSRIRPIDIEETSMDLIGCMLDIDGYPNPEGDVIRRIIHACGDSSISGRIRIHPEAVNTAITAIRTGSDIITDSRMTAAGINRTVSTKFNCRIHCALDDTEAARVASGQGITRSAAGIRLLSERLNGAVAVIGNAPTALAELLRLSLAGSTRPAVIIGIPVGFVQARETKMALLEQNIPYITVTGSRGGSAMAVAAFNALSRLAANSKQVVA